MCMIDEVVQKKVRKKRVNFTISPSEVCGMRFSLESGVVDVCARERGGAERGSVANPTRKVSAPLTLDVEHSSRPSVSGGDVTKKAITLGHHARLGGRAAGIISERLVGV